MKIGVLCPLSNLDRKYSVAACVEDQLEILTLMGHEVFFLTTDDFKDQPICEVWKYERWLDNDLAYPARTSEVLKSYLEGLDHVFIHDVFLVREYRQLALALNLALEVTETPISIWSHSVCNGKAEVQPHRGKLVCLNKFEIEKTAEFYGKPYGDVRVVHNMIDPAKHFNWNNEMQTLVHQFKLWERDILITYPTRTHPSKQADQIVRLVKALKDHGLDVFFIWANSYPGGVEGDIAFKAVKSLIHQYDLEENVLITSETPDWKMGVRPETVRQLMQYSDLFILPSLSEACSLTMLEAGLSKNLIVLNEDVFNLQEFGGQKIDDMSSERALYMQFGSLTRKISAYHPSQEEWFKDQSERLLQYLNSDISKSFFRYCRKHHYPEFIYQNGLSPLLS